jgi:hypothetical protein
MVNLSERSKFLLILAGVVILCGVGLLIWAFANGRFSSSAADTGTIVQKPGEITGEVHDGSASGPRVEGAGAKAIFVQSVSDPGPGTATSGSATTDSKGVFHIRPGEKVMKDGIYKVTVWKGSKFKTTEPKTCRFWKRYVGPIAVEDHTNCNFGIIVLGEPDGEDGSKNGTLTGTAKRDNAILCSQQGLHDCPWVMTFTSTPINIGGVPVNIYNQSSGTNYSKSLEPGIYTISKIEALNTETGATATWNSKDPITKTIAAGKRTGLAITFILDK